MQGFSATRELPLWEDSPTVVGILGTALVHHGEGTGMVLGP